MNRKEKTMSEKRDKRMQVVLTESGRAKVEEIGRAYYVSLNEVINRAIDDYYKRYKDDQLKMQLIIDLYDAGSLANALEIVKKYEQQAERK